MNTNVLSDNALESVAGGRIIPQLEVKNGTIFSTNQRQFAFRDIDGVWHKYDNPADAYDEARIMFGDAVVIQIDDKVFLGINQKRSF